MTEELSDKIERSAGGPRRVSVDGVSVEGQPIGEMIEADRYAKAQSATSRNHFGLRFAKLEPPRAG